MGGKISPLIILVVLAVVAVVGLFVFNIINNTNNNASYTTQEQAEINAKTTVNLTSEMSDDSMSAKLTIEVVTLDEDGVSEIKLPDETSVTAVNKTEYSVEKNGTYKFTVIMNNGDEIEKEIEITDIKEAAADNPYLPNGFKVVESDVEKGYVISDSAGNEYVWVPVEKGMLTRDTQLNGDYEETATSTLALVNSVAKYQGFYLGRYEASEYRTSDGSVAASMKNKAPWTNINYTDASKAASDSYVEFGYGDDYPTAIINSYTWDTALNWINKTYEGYSSSLSYGNYEGAIALTGSTTDKTNNIYDLAGNVREWTTEIYKKGASTLAADSKNLTAIFRVVRGGGASLSKTPASHIGYVESDSEEYRGFRLILYKQN